MPWLSRVLYPLVAQGLQASVSYIAHRGITRGRSLPSTIGCQTLNASSQPRRPYVVVGPVFRRVETAVTSCAGANGLHKRMLLGTPCEAHWSAAWPVM